MTSAITPFGFNVIGYASNSGIGVATQRVCELLDALAVPYSRFDVERRSPVSGTDEYPAIGAADLPYSINLFVIPVNVVDLLFKRFESDVLRTDRLNAAICFWELPTLPPRWIPSLDRLDVLIAMSDYMLHVFALATSGPWIVPGRLPCPIPDTIGSDRLRFGIRDDAVVFVSSFEPASDSQRKNPLGVVEAFLLALADDEKALLVLRVKNAGPPSNEHPVVEALRTRLDGHPRVRLVLDELDYDGILTLYKSCDVFVSLHRAEGLGLGMLEAMGLGLPVIATGWSGNMTFMDHRSACLVRHDLVPVKAEIRAYDADQLEDTTVWADPDIQHAARWMQRLAHDRPFRLAMAQRSRARYSTELQLASVGGFIDEMRHIADARRRGDVSRSRETTTRREARHERLAKIQALERELQWIKSRPDFRFLQSVRRLFKSGSSA